MSDRDPDITLGRISGVFGLKGWVKVFSYTDPREAILEYQPWLLGPDMKPVTIEDGKPHGKTIVARLPGVATPEQARTLVNQDIRVPRASLPTSEEGAWFWSDLVGVTVVNESGVELGKIQRLFETGANDVMVVRGERERLVPFVHGPVVRDVDLEAMRMIVDWHEED